MSAREWSRYQRDIFSAVAAADGGNLLVDAKAGSGKTTTIVEAAKLAPHALFCAFNKHTAETLKSRLPQGTTASTIHGVGYRTLRPLGRFKSPDPRKYADKTNEICFDLAAQVWGDVPAPEQRRETMETVKDLVHYCRVHLVDPSDRPALLEMADRFGVDGLDSSNAAAYSRAAAEILAWGRQRAIAKQEIDFDDMLWLPHVLKLRPERFPLAFIDEAQDLSRAQLALALGSAEGGRIVAVGDPAQSIYAFSGADHESFREIQRKTSARILPLSVCYRCPSSVIELAQTICPSIEAAPGAPAGIVEELNHELLFERARVGDLVLSRTNARAVADCLGMLARRIPARMRGKDIGRKLLSLVDAAGDAGGRSRWSDFSKILDAHVGAKVARLQQQGKDGQADSLLDMAEAVRVCLVAFAAPDLPSFRKQLDDLFQESGDVVWFSTIHRAKGLEFPRVFILDYDRLPLRWKNQKSHEAEQERNLLYVAITRAMSELYLVSSTNSISR